MVVNSHNRNITDCVDGWMDGWMNGQIILDFLYRNIQHTGPTAVVKLTGNGPYSQQVIVKHGFSKQTDLFAFFHCY